MSSRYRDTNEDIDNALIQHKQIFGMPRPSNFDRRLVKQFQCRQGYPIQSPDHLAWGMMPVSKAEKKKQRKTRSKGKRLAATIVDDTHDDPDSDVSELDCSVPNGELVCFASTSENDLFSRWIAERLVHYFPRWMPTSKDVGVAGFEYDEISRLSTGIRNVIASVLPCVAIAVLYSLKSTWVRLGVLTAFNVLITICLNVLTKAKPTEIFSISAA
jgi:hypothetical protein